MNVIKDSQFSTKSAKPLLFGQDTGFFRLLEGESTSFSFSTVTGTVECSFATTTPPPRPPVSTPVFTVGTTSSPSVPTYGVTSRPPFSTPVFTPTTVVPTSGIFTVGTTSRPTDPSPRYVSEVTTSRTSTSGPTYLPPTTLGSVSLLKVRKIFENS